MSLASTPTNREQGLPMCKFCVDEGRMTQADLDAMMAAGDRTVVPMLELTPDEFKAANEQLVLEAIEGGESPIIAVILGALVAQEYEDNIRVRLN